MLQDNQIGGMDEFLLGDESQNDPDDSYNLIPDPKETRSKEKGWVNNLNVEPYSWYPDFAYPGADTPLHLVEIQRYLVVEKSVIRISWCLVVTPKGGRAHKYQRVGLCLVRYQDPEDHPFINDESAREKIRIV